MTAKAKDGGALRSRALPLGMCSVALGLVLAASYLGRAAIERPGEVTALGFLGTALVIALCCAALLALFLSRGFLRWGAALADFSFALRARNVVALTAAMLLLWAPVMLLMAPFHIGPDTIAQLLWWEGYPVFDPSSRAFLPDAAMSDHHPVLVTVVYGLCYDLGTLLLGTPERAFRAFCALQSAAMAATFSYACCWLRERGAPPMLCLGAFLFWACLPIFPMMMQEVVKDMLSMPVFVLWAMAFADCFWKVRERAPLSRGFSAYLAALTLLGALTRKTLLYITVPSLLALAALAAWAWWKERRKGAAARDASAARRLLAIAAVPAVIMLVVLPKVVFPLASVAPGGPQEMLAVPIQQVSAVVAEHGEELSEEDRAIIGRVLPYDELAGAYSPSLADPVKDLWKRDSNGADRAAFLMEWLRLGLRYPGDYLQSVAYLNNFWLTGACVVGPPVVVWGWEDRGGSDLFPAYGSGYRTEGQQQLVDGVIEGLWGHGPLPMRLLLDTATYVLWVPAFSLALLLLRGRRNWPVAVPLLLSMAVAFVAPAFQARYVLNLVFLAPLLPALSYLWLRPAGEGDGAEGAGSGCQAAGRPSPEDAEPPLPAEA